MRPNYIGLNQGLGQISQGFAQQQIQQRQQQQQMQQALQMLIFETQIKKMFDPEAQFRQQMMSMFQGQGDGRVPPQQSIPQGGGVNAGGGFRPKGFNYGGFSFEREATEQDRQQDIDTAVKKQTAIENAKPYTEGEVKIASGLSLIPQIDKLIKLIEDKNIYGEGKLAVPFGASRISAFGEKGPWQSFKRGLTAGPGREAGLILQDIKQIMFATGGQALTDPEILKLAPKMEPAYKTEKQWIEDLKDVRQRIIDKVRLMRPNPNQAFPLPTTSGQQGKRQLDKNTAIRLLNQAGGNKDKARTIAQQQGYQF